MADITNLSNFLGDIASAIREKKGTTEPIPAQEFDSEIASIETGVDTSDATAVAEDIISPKTAYVNDKKIKGSIIPTYEVVSGAITYSSKIYDGGTSYLTIGFAPDNSFSIELNYTKQALVVRDENFNIVKEELISTFVPDYTVSYDGRLYVSISVAGVQNNADCHYVCVSLNDYKSFITVFNYNTKEFNYQNSGYTSFYPIAEDWNIGVCPAHTYFSEINPKLLTALIHDGNNYKRPYYMVINDDGTISYTDLLGGNKHQGNGDHLLNITPTANGLALQFLFSSTGWNYNSPSTTLRRRLAYMNSAQNGFSFSGDISYTFSPNGKIATDGTNIYDCVFNTTSKTYTLTERFNLGGTYTVLYFINDTTFVTWSTNKNIKLFVLNLDDNTMKIYDYVLDNPLSLSSTTTINTLNIVSTSYRALKIDTQDILMTMNRNNTMFFNTSDADVSENDVMSGKVVYGRDGKITGTLPNYGAGLNTGVESITPDTGYDGSFIEFKSPEQDGPFAFTSDKVRLLMTPRMSEVAEGIGLVPEIIVKGNTVLGIEGTAESGSGAVKLFETEEEMQADTDPKEGDLALVYRNEISNATVDSQFSSIKFPATVVLPAAITEDDYISTSFRSVDSDVWLDCWCSLEYTSFRASIYADDMNLSITYTSEDGMTYTRTDTEAEIIDLPGEVYCEYTNEWNDYIGYFVLVNGYTFDGLFQYSGKTHKNIVNFISTSDITVGSGSVTIARTTDNIQNINIDLLFTNNVIPRQVRIRFGTKDGKLTAVFAKKTDGTYSDIDHDSSSIQCDEAGTTFYDKPQYSADSLIMRVIEADNSTYTDYELEKVTFGSTFRYRLDTDTLPSFILYENNYQFDTVTNIGKWNSGAEVFQNNYFSMPDDYYPIINAYYYADTQLNIKSSNQLLPGKKAYGNNGVIIGDGSVYENLDTTLVNTNLLKVKLGNDESR